MTFEEAVKSIDGDKWKNLCKKSYSLIKNQTWSLVEKPKGQKLVGCKWIFKRKEGILGVEKASFKARMVAKGFTQREGIDY